MVNAPEAYVSPYGIAISKQAAGSELEQRLVYALTGWVCRRAGCTWAGCVHAAVQSLCWCVCSKRLLRGE